MRTFFYLMTALLLASAGASGGNAAADCGSAGSKELVPTVWKDAGTVAASVSATIETLEFDWTFDQPVTTGHFIDGQPWIVVPAEGVRLIAASPTRINRVEVEDRRGQPVTADINITVINPPVGDVYEDLSPDNPRLAMPVDAFGWDSRGTIESGLGRRYDPALGWDGQTPVKLVPGDVVTTAKSFVEMERDNGNPNWKQYHETALEAVAVLTVLAEAPPEDAFRPGVIRADAVRIHPEFIRYADLREDLDGYLISLPQGDLYGASFPSAFPYQVGQAATVPERFSADRLTSLMPGPHIMNIGFVDSRAANAYRNNSGATYSANISINMGELAIGAMAEWLTPEQRRTCRIRFIQRTIDMYEAVRAGLCLSYDGGMMTAYGLRFALAGQMLNHAGMQAMDTTVHGLPSWYFLGDYGQVAYLGDPGNPGADAPPVEDARFIPWNSDSLQINAKLRDVPVAEATEGPSPSVRVPDDFIWQGGVPVERIYRAGRAIPNSKFRIIEGAGSGDTIYTVIELIDFMDAGGSAPANLATALIRGGVLRVKPDWQNGLPDATSRLRFQTAVAEEANRWVFKQSGISRPNRYVVYDDYRMELSPIADYSTINVGAHLPLLIPLYALQAQKAYSAGMDKWMIQIGEIPGYGEVTYEITNWAHHITRPPANSHPERAFLGGLWKEQVLDRVGSHFIRTGRGLDALPVAGPSQ